MNKKILYLVSACLCVMLAGCDDFLDTESLIMKDTSNFPVNETDATQMVNGIYSVMNRNLADPEEDPFFIYFNLAQVFNGVPLVLKTEPQNLPKATPDEVYAQIASDLKKAIEYGPSIKYPEFGEGRVSKWAAEGMMARVWLFYTGFYKKNLKKERRYELCFEAIRWNDLRRWGDVQEKVKNQVGNNILNQGITGQYAFTNDFMQRYSDTGGGFFKIPEDQVTLSEGVLEQNPGWGDGTTWAKGDLPYKFK